MHVIHAINHFETVKVGGMRVVQHKRATSETEKTEEEKPAEEVPKEESEETDVTEKE